MNAGESDQARRHRTARGRPRLRGQRGEPCRVSRGHVSMAAPATRCLARTAPPTNASTSRRRAIGIDAELGGNQRGDLADVSRCSSMSRQMRAPTAFEAKHDAASHVEQHQPIVGVEPLTSGETRTRSSSWRGEGKRRAAGRRARNRALARDAGVLARCARMRAPENLARPFPLSSPGKNGSLASFRLARSLLPRGSRSHAAVHWHNQQAI